MNLNLRPAINSAYQEEQFDQELLLYNEQSEQALYLNDTAQVVLQLCKANLTVGQIISSLQEHYPESSTVIEGEVIETIKTLASHDLIFLTDD